MKIKLATLLLAFGGFALAHSAAAHSLFKIAPSSQGKIGAGRCYMDSCTWSKILSNKVISQTGHETLVKTIILGGITHHRNGNYPNTAPKKIKWDSKPHAITTICSYHSPSVIIDYQIYELDFETLPGVLESSANLYFNICHNYYGGYYDGTKKFGYK